MERKGFGLLRTRGKNEAIRPDLGNVEFVPAEKDDVSNISGSDSGNGSGICSENHPVSEPGNIEGEDPEEAEYGWDRHNAIAVEKFLKEKVCYFQKEGADYIQGYGKCPICGGRIDYTWSRIVGFHQYECSGKDCLPYPIGGAKYRRENGLPKIVPERYRKGGEK